MDWKAHIRSALGARLDEDVLEELAQHAAATYASARAEGCETGEAERRVTQQIHAWAADPARSARWRSGSRRRRLSAAWRMACC